VLTPILQAAETIHNSKQFTLSIQNRSILEADVSPVCDQCGSHRQQKPLSILERMRRINEKYMCACQSYPGPYTSCTTRV
jgi:hypothetical protein